LAGNEENEATLNSSTYNGKKNLKILKYIYRILIMKEMANSIFFKCLMTRKPSLTILQIFQFGHQSGNLSGDLSLKGRELIFSEVSEKIL